MIRWKLRRTTVVRCVLRQTTQATVIPCDPLATFPAYSIVRRDLIRSSLESERPVFSKRQAAVQGPTGFISRRKLTGGLPCLDTLDITNAPMGTHTNHYSYRRHFGHTRNFALPSLIFTVVLFATPPPRPPWLHMKRL